jgi:YidC/Oxa1 family membrane protein insertase
MDKNQIIGISLITVLMLGYFGFMSTQTPETPLATPPAITQTVETDTAIAAATAADTALKAQNQREYGDFAAAMTGEAKEYKLENKDVVVTLSTKGGVIKSVLLKNYFTWDKKQLFLFSPENNQLSLIINTNKKPIDLYNLYYAGYETKAGDKQILTFKTDAGNGKTIEHTYALGAEGFLVDYNVKMSGFGSELPNIPLTLDWREQVERIEYDAEQARVKATVNYMQAEDGFDYLSEASKDKETETLSNVQWISLKQKFFNSGFIAREGSTIPAATVTAYPMYNALPNAPVNTEKYIKSLEAQVQLPLESVISGKAAYSFFFGPNDFKVCKAVPTENYHKNVNLGWPLISWINRFVVIPVFDGLKGVFSSFGLIIVILVLLIKLVLLPLSYKSYVSMAKMKALKPELDELKAKHPDDQQAIQMEQMQVYKQFGINPLSGCIPVLLQMPILLAMFSFFPNAIDLRGESLWWATDLSSYDEFAKLPFSIPFYGSHVSMFTLLMTVSTLVYTWVNNQVSTVTGPMKYMSYAMPVVFLFVLNSFPAGLSFYYFISNLVTIAQQLIIRRFVNEGDLRLQLEAARDKNLSGDSTGGAPKKNRFMARMEEAMKQREQQQQFKNNTKKK